MSYVPDDMVRQFMTVALAAAVGSVFVACSTPCGQLRDRVEGCGTAESAFVEERQSVCAETRKEVGTNRFDSFSDCIARSPCSDDAAFDRCQQKHIPAASDNSCTVFKLWTAACGLEPVGTDQNCNDIGEGFTGSNFDAWVDCVTADGCPKVEEGERSDENRFTRCRDEIIEPRALSLLDACVLISDWSGRCAGASNTLPVEDTPIPLCFAQAAPYTTESYSDYAICLSALPCEHRLSQRLECLFQLRISERTRLEEQCQELVDYTSACGTIIGSGGTVQICTFTFGTSTPESFDDYIACIKSNACADIAAAVPGCAMLLVDQ